MLPPARVSNFVKDFLAGAYHCTRKESKHVYGFVGGARLWEGCSMSPYVLGILYGVAMHGLGLNPLKRGKESGWKKKG